jgi:N-acetylglutamate synthase-like GNAT family acetyltransferase
LIAVGPELRLGGATITNGDFRASRGGAFFLARSAGRAIGCGGLRRLSADIGEIKRLFVSREARGQSAGRGLLEALEERARALGYDRLRLDTPGNDAAALALFRASGYQPIPDYNANTRARYWFEKALGRD